jgi:hypothetical protein
MEEFFQNDVFVNEYNKLSPYRKSKIVEIMKEMKESDTSLTTDIFICILQKMNRPYTSASNYSAFLYMASVNTWNTYIDINQKNSTFKITGPGLVY